MSALVQLLPLADYQAGVTPSPEIDVPDSARSYELRLARCTDQTPDVWPDAQQLLRVQVELFIRGQWLPWGSFDAYGGRHLQRDGTTGACSWLRAGLRDVAPGRKLRAFLLAAAPVRASIEIEVT